MAATEVTDIQDVKSDAASIPYAVPAVSYANKVWAAFAIVLAGLGLIALGGCFLIGVLILSGRGFLAAGPLTTRAAVLMAVLYSLAAVCFVAATAVLVSGLAALFRVTRA